MSSSPSDPSITSGQPSRWTPWLLAYGVVLVGAVALAVFRLHNDDAGFHIATGRWIRDHGHVPLFNPFSLVQDGASWLQHQWLFALGMSWVVDTFGVAALVGLKAAIVGLVFSLLAWHLVRNRIPIGLGSVALASAVVASAFRFYERPFLASILALTVTSIALLRWYADSLEGRRWPVLALLTTALAWHLHAGALHSVLAWCALTGGCVVSTGLSWRDGGEVWAEHLRRLRLASAWLLACVGLSALGLWLLAPAGLQPMLLPARLSSNTYWHEHLAEFRPLRLSAMYALQWFGVAVSVVVIAASAWRRHWFGVLLVAGMTYVACRHQRMVWAMMVVAIATLGSLHVSEPLRGRLRPVGVRLALVLLATLIIALGWLDQSSWFRMGLGDDGLDHRRHPVALIQRAAALPGETLVSDGLAGTWLWWAFRDRDDQDVELPPERRRRVLVHNCLECYEEATYIERYQHIRYAKPGWEKMVDDLGIRSFLLKYTTAGERRFQAGKPNLRQHLFAGPRWLLVDFDDIAAVYVDRDHVPATVNVLSGFPIDPDTGRALAGTSYRVGQLALVEHAIAHPDGQRALDIAARRAYQAGDTAALSTLMAEALRRDPDSATARQLMALIERRSSGGKGLQAGPTLQALREALARKE